MSYTRSWHVKSKNEYCKGVWTIVWVNDIGLAKEIPKDLTVKIIYPKIHRDRKKPDTRTLSVPPIPPLLWSSCSKDTFEETLPTYLFKENAFRPLANSTLDRVLQDSALRTHLQLVRDSRMLPWRSCRLATPSFHHNVSHSFFRDKATAPPAPLLPLKSANLPPREEETMTLSGVWGRIEVVDKAPPERIQVKVTPWTERASLKERIMIQGKAEKNLF